MLTQAQKDAWLARLRDPNTPNPGSAFGGKCALFYLLPKEQFGSQDRHWEATKILIGTKLFFSVAIISDDAVAQGRAHDAFKEAANWIEANVPCSAG